MESVTSRAEDLQYVQALFDAVRTFSADGPGVTRQGYGPVENRTLDFLAGLGRELRLEVAADAAGNVWMTLPGRDRTLPAFVAGSHADSVPQGGNYDGLAGIAAALLTARRMRREGFTPLRDFRVLMMRCEESSFFGKAYVGSLGMLGLLKESDLALRHRTTGGTLAGAIRSCGVDPERLTTGLPVIDPSRIAAFVELHIEQGPTLDHEEKARVGIVTGIRGNIRHKSVKCLGETAHSGAVDKAFRHDALMAASRLISTLEEDWQAWIDRGEDLVFTVGVLSTGTTAAISVIPGEVVFTVDIRSLSTRTIETFHDQLLLRVGEVEAARGVRFEWDAPLRTAPGTVSEALSGHLCRAAEKAGIPCLRLASGAGHDAAVIGNYGIPAAMIFVANQHGSHNPREAMKIEDFMTGCDLLWEAVRTYDES